MRKHAELLKTFPNTQCTFITFSYIIEGVCNACSGKSEIRNLKIYSENKTKLKNKYDKTERKLINS